MRANITIISASQLKGLSAAAEKGGGKIVLKVQLGHDGEKLTSSVQEGPRPTWDWTIELDALSSSKATASMLKVTVFDMSVTPPVCIGLIKSDVAALALHSNHTIPLYERVSAKEAAALQGKKMDVKGYVLIRVNAIIQSPPTPTTTGGDITLTVPRLSLTTTATPGQSPPVSPAHSGQHQQQQRSAAGGGGANPRAVSLGFLVCVSHVFRVVQQVFDILLFADVVASLIVFVSVISTVFSGTLLGYSILGMVVFNSMKLAKFFRRRRQQEEASPQPPPSAPCPFLQTTTRWVYPSDGGVLLHNMSRLNSLAGDPARVGESTSHFYCVMTSMVRVDWSLLPLAGVFIGLACAVFSVRRVLPWVWILTSVAVPAWYYVGGMWQQVLASPSPTTLMEIIETARKRRPTKQTSASLPALSREELTDPLVQRLRAVVRAATEKSSPPPPSRASINSGVTTASEVSVPSLRIPETKPQAPSLSSASPPRSEVAVARGGGALDTLLNESFIPNVVVSAPNTPRQPVAESYLSSPVQSAALNLSAFMGTIHKHVPSPPPTTVPDRAYMCVFLDFESHEKKSEVVAQILNHYQTARNATVGSARPVASALPSNIKNSLLVQAMQVGIHLTSIKRAIRYILVHSKEEANGNVALSPMFDLHSLNVSATTKARDFLRREDLVTRYLMPTADIAAIEAELEQSCVMLPTRPELHPRDLESTLCVASLLISLFTLHVPAIYSQARHTFLTVVLPIVAPKGSSVTDVTHWPPPLGTNCVCTSASKIQHTLYSQWEVSTESRMPFDYLTLMLHHCLSRQRRASSSATTASNSTGQAGAGAGGDGSLGVGGGAELESSSRSTPSATSLMRKSSGQNLMTGSAAPSPGHRSLNSNRSNINTNTMNTNISNTVGGGGLPELLQQQQPATMVSHHRYHSFDSHPSPSNISNSGGKASHHHNHQVKSPNTHRRQTASHPVGGVARRRRSNTNDLVFTPQSQQLQ